MFARLCNEVNVSLYIKPLRGTSITQLCVYGVYVCVCMCVCMHLCMCACIHVWMDLWCRCRTA